MNDDSLRALLHWVREREAIRERKERGDPFPWTDDPILRAWRYCNVRREDDRVTRWIKENIRDRFAGYEHLWFMLAAARMINWPPTLEELIRSRQGWPGDVHFSPEKIGWILEDLKRHDRKVFTGAYIIPAPTTAGQTKGHYIATTVLGNLWMNRERIAAVLKEREELPDGSWRSVSMRRVNNELTRYRGWGPFLAYQAIVDMRFTTILANAPDVWTWAAAGPGTIRGLNRLHGRPYGLSYPQEWALEEMRELFPLIKRETGVELDFSDVPNCLCEFDKFERVRLGQGTPRARYVPGRGC